LKSRRREKWFDGYPISIVHRGCQVETTGTVEAGGLGKITKYTVVACGQKKGKNECGGSLSAYAVNLPWKTELYESGTQIVERIVSGGTGTPEFHMVCEGHEDNCALNTSAAMENLGGGEAVDAVFGPGSGKTFCGAGGSEASKWEGELRIARPAGVEGLVVK
jgi:hypothetical protein